MPTPPPPMRSKCCEAPLETSYGEEGTNCYVCTKCKNPSDPIPPSTSAKATEDTSGSIGNPIDATPTGTYDDLTNSRKPPSSGREAQDMTHKVYAPDPFSPSSGGERFGRDPFHGHVVNSPEAHLENARRIAASQIPASGAEKDEVLNLSLSRCCGYAPRYIAGYGYVTDICGKCGGDFNTPKLTPSSGAEKCEHEWIKTVSYYCDKCELQELESIAFGSGPAPSSADLSAGAVAKEEGVQVAVQDTPLREAEGCEHDFVQFRDDPHKTCRKCFQEEGVGDCNLDHLVDEMCKLAVDHLLGNIDDDSMRLVRSQLKVKIRSTLAAERSRVEGEWRKKIEAMIKSCSFRVGFYDEPIIFASSASEALLPTPTSQGGNEKKV